MSETYPVLINGEKKGTLTVSREGLTTRFDAKCEDPGEETGDGSGAGRTRPSRAEAVRRAEAARARGGYRLARRRGRESVHGV